jgi:hypothetical protein
VNRSEHGWGRVSVYGGTVNNDGGVITEMSDHDLCPAHYQKVLDVLWSPA